MRQPEYDTDAASSDHSSRTSDFNDSASEIIRRLCPVPGGLGLSHGQGGPVDEDGNYLYSQIYPHYQRRPSQEFDPPSQSKDSETLDPQSARSPVARSSLATVDSEGSTEETQNVIEPSTDSMRLETPHIVDSDKKSEVRKPGGLSRLKRSRNLSNTDGSHDPGADSELHQRQSACDTTDSQAKPSTKKQRISEDDRDKPAEPPVGSNLNTVDMANLGREIVGVLQAQTAVLASVLKVISSQ
ncbi:hypothetical protein CY34DRAFT_105240 [Suillus luteus UH-Slu-Lm8-n1]|uniref:Uncharacterized protein n=1 Tax=Suillus luteus UH-Slu-Lm8-n1 TaxID=930992 RepID=A0A0D0BJI5_9AGAM|nr:hypothetical protein CY34DRAFT_105240 [Suillus luteus UH-Slu-Lm8-n1]